MDKLWGKLWAKTFEAEIKCGRPFSYYLGQRPVILIADPEMIKEIAVKQFNNFCDRQVY